MVHEKKIRIEITYLLPDENKDRPNKFEYTYNDETTVQDMLDYCKSNIEYDVFVNFAYISQFIKEDYIIGVKHGGKMVWRVPYCECLLSDYIETYGLRYIKLTMISGIGCPGNGVTDVLFDVLDKLSILIAVYEISKPIFEKLKRWFKDKCCHLGEYITLEELATQITSTKIWEINKLMNIYDIDCDSAKVLLEFFGFLYSKKDDKYYFSEVKYKENKELLLKSVHFENEGRR